MRTQFILCIVLVSPLLANGQFSPENAEYIWPTNASPYLSGTFGETRSQHFHSALDIKTWGRRGYRVYATRDGILHRIAIGPRGYGKVVYLKHPDGSYSVYAHLLTFEDSIQKLADAIRFEDYSHEIDRVVDSLGIAINQGQLLGYSGATGVGPPHLHFELRTPTEKPFNPLLTNLSIPDNRPPRFSAISVEPLSPEARIEGQNRIYTRRSVAREGQYYFGTIDVSGPVGLGVDVFDMADRVSNAYAVYDLKLYLRDRLLFHSRVDSFSYEETDQMFLDRVYPILRQRGSGYQRLYIADGNSLPFYNRTGGSGRLNPEEGLHPLRIVAEDYFGNRSEAMLTLNVENAGTPMISRTNGSNGSDGTNGGNGNGSGTNVMEDGWNWHADWINLNGDPSQDYLITAIDTALHASLPLRVNASSFVELNKFDFISIQAPGKAPYHLMRVLPGRDATVHGTGIDAYAKFGAGTFYDTVSVGLSGTAFSRDSVMIRIQPDNQPIRNEFELTYILDDSRLADSTLAFYFYNQRRNRLSYIPSRIGGTVLKGNGDKLGRYFILRDILSPTLSRPRIFRREDGKWIASVRVEDSRSGVEPSKTLFYINGVRGIAEFEPEDERILYYHPDFIPAKVNELRIVVVDKVGNRTEREFRLQ